MSDDSDDLDSSPPKNEAKPEKATPFTRTERAILIENYVENRNVLTARDTTNAQKNSVYKEITRNVNSVATQARNVQQVKKKLDNELQKARSLAVAQAEHAGGTGGGPPLPKASPLTGSLVGLFAKSVQVHGIKGGVNTGTTRIKQEPFDRPQSCPAKRNDTSRDSSSSIVDLSDEEDFGIAKGKQSAAKYYPEAQGLSAKRAFLENKPEVSVKKPRASASSDVEAMQKQLLQKQMEVLDLERVKLEIEIETAKMKRSIATDKIGAIVSRPPVAAGGKQYTLVVPNKQVTLSVAKPPTLGD